MELCFNELSLSEQCSEEQAVYKLNGLLDVVRKAYAISAAKPTFRTECGFRNIEISKNYTVSKWMGNLQREARLFMLSMLDRSPYIDEKDASVYEQYRLSYFVSKDVDEHEAKGLGAAWLLDGVAVSLAGIKEWNKLLVSIRQQKIDDSENIDEVDIDVRNAVSVAHMEVHKSYYGGIDYCERQLDSLGQLQKLGQKFFPAIVFGDTVYDWLEKNTLSSAAFQRIIHHLYRLNQFFSEQVACGNCNLRILPRCSNESESTMNQFSNRRNFLFKGRNYNCEWHLKLNTDNIRIHFFPDFANGKAYVGYIGPHLPTRKYRK